MSNQNITIADHIRNHQNMLAGIGANSERLAKRGLDSKFLSDYSANFESVVTLDGEHEAAKAHAKEKSAAFRTQLEKVGQYYREARKLVKVEMPRESWKEFGVYDER